MVVIQASFELSCWWKTEPKMTDFVSQLPSSWVIHLSALSANLPILDAAAALDFPAGVLGKGAII